MPTSSAPYRSALIATIFALSGCASAPQGGSTAERFVDSTSDVTDRAPASMALPATETASGSKNSDSIDPAYMRTQADYHFTLGDTYSLQGESAKAIEEYKLTLIYDPKSTLVRLRLAGEYVKQQLVSEAVEQAETAISLDPNDVDARLLLGGLYTAMRVYDKASGQYAAVMKLEPGNADAPMFMGALLAEQKKFDDAIKYFSALEGKSGKNAYLAPYYIGRIIVEQKKKDFFRKAELSFQKALILKPSFVEAVVALGSLYEENKKTDDAIALYADFQEQHGPDTQIAESLSKIYLDQDKYDKAYSQLELLEAGDADDLNTKIKMAYIQIERKDYPHAISKLQEILVKAPYSDKVRFYLGAVYEETKQYPQAIEQFTKIPAGTPYYNDGILHAAYLYKMTGDIDHGLLALKDGMKASDDHAPFYALYASFLDDQKKYKEALAFLETAVGKFPKHAQLRFFLGSVQDRLGQTDNSIISMQEVLKLDDGHVQALNYLAYTYADHNQHLDDAEKLVRRANSLQPKDPYIMDTLGWVLFKKGKTGEAVRTLETAYKLQPSESIIAEHLGDAYYKSQLPDKAKSMYQKAAEGETDSETLKKLRQKLVSVEKQMQTVVAKPVSVDSERVPASTASH